MIQASPAHELSGEMELASGQGRRRLVEIGVFAILIAGAIAALPGLGDLRDRLAGADLSLVAAVAAVELGSCLAFVLAFRGVFNMAPQRRRGSASLRSASQGRLPWRFSYEVAMSEQAANVLLPTGGAGGLALGAWALKRIGMPAERIGRRTVAFFLVTSSINFIAVVIAGVGLATGLLPGEVALATALVPAALAALAIAVVVLTPRLLDGAGPADGGRVRRAIAAGRTHVAAGIRDAVRLLGSGRPSVVFGAVGYMALDVVALALAFAALGGGAPAPGVFLLAYTIGQLGGIVPVPGGIGGTDGGLILAFGLLGTPVAAAGAAVIAYRAFQLGVPAILGLAAFAGLRRSLSDPELAGEPCEAGDPCFGGAALEPSPA
jgi:uncharacterized membrane protein YbhN (UPF0104 family)